MKPPPDAQVLESSTTIMWYDDESGVVCVVSKKGPVRTPETLKKTLEGLKKLGGDDKTCLLMDITNISEVTREGREYLAREFPKFVKAIALLSESVFGKMVANLFFTIKKQPYPTKRFTDEQAAIKWLKQHQS